MTSSKPDVTAPRATSEAPTRISGARKLVMEFFDVGPGVAVAAIMLTLAVLLAAGMYVARSAPPSEIVITTGPEGSSTRRTAERYAKILERNKIKLTVLASNGSSENLKALQDASKRVDVGFVQGGVAKEAVPGLVSLGNVSYQPLMIYYRGKPIERLSGLVGKRVAIGPEGSGARIAALEVLKANGVHDKGAPVAPNRLGEGGAADGNTDLLDLTGEEAVQALLDKKIDAAFVMGESTPMPLLRRLSRTAGVNLFSVQQPGAYARKLSFLNVLELPRGSFDLGQDIPPRDVTLVGPTVELVARQDLHPALSDLLLEAMHETHARPGIYQKRGEFPNASVHVFPLSEDASRYYKSGKSFLYRYLPFWVASFVSRFLFAIIPALVVLIPILRSLPSLFRWRVDLRIRRYYRELIDLEKRYLAETDPERRAGLRRELDEIEAKVYGTRIRPAFAHQYYVLRSHIGYVRGVVARSPA